MPKQFVSSANAPTTGFTDLQKPPPIAQAIRFGDLMDEESEVRKQVENERGYKILGDINTYPSVTYLKKVTRRMPA